MVTMNKKDIFTFMIFFMLGANLVIPIFTRNHLLSQEIEYEGGDTIDSTVVSSLSFEEVDPYWIDTGVRLTNSYVDMNLTAKEVFVPDDLSDLTEHFTYDMQEWHEDQARFWVTLTYMPSYCGWAGNPCIYPSEDLDALLGNSEWTNSSYPNNRFQISNKEVWATNKTDRGYVCDVAGFIDEESDFNVSWGITVKSHYYHVIIDYDLYFTNYTYDSANDTYVENNQVVRSFQDVYSGDKPNLLPIDYDVEKLALNRTMINFVQHADFVDRATLEYDNLYGDNSSINVTIAYPTDEEFKGFTADDVWFEYTDDLYDDVVYRATGSGLTDTLVTNAEDFEFHSYKVNVSSDTVETMYFDVESDAKKVSPMYIWITGSWAGGGGSPGEWGDGNWKYRKEITITDNIDDYQSLMNISYDTTNAINVSSSGKWIVIAVLD